MEYRQLGNSGLKVSIISLGTWFTIQNYEHCKDVIQTAFSLGINFFDTAESYDLGKTEILLGKAIKDLNLPREELVISTKLYFGFREPMYISDNSLLCNSKGLSRKHIFEGMNASLKRMNLEYVDIVYAHRYDEDVDIEEICRSFHELIEKGKTFYWGTSEWPASRISQAHQVCDKFGLIKPISEQAQYNLLVRERVEKEYESVFLKTKMGLAVWSPLCGGILSGKYLDGIPENSRITKDVPFYVKERFNKFCFHENMKEKRKEQFQTLKEISEELQCSVAQLALAWILYNKNTTTVIIGASSKEQILENVKSIQIMKKLTQDHINRIENVF